MTQVKTPRMPKSVRIEEAADGYIVSTYEGDGDREQKLVCKSVEEAMSKARDLFGTKKEREDKSEDKSEGSYKERA